MRRLLFLVALLGAVSFTAGCDDKPKTSAPSSANDPMGAGTAPVPK